MPEPSLYDADERYTAEALQLSDTVEQALRQVFSHYIKLGYRIREISHIVHGTVTDLELDAVLTRRELVEGTLTERPQLLP